MRSIRIFAKPAVTVGSEVLLSEGPGQQLIDGAVRMTIDDPGEDVGQVHERVDIVQLTGLDQRGDDGPVFGAAIGPCEQSIFLVPKILEWRRDHIYARLDGTLRLHNPA
jgi:hypothetical protein